MSQFKLYSKLLTTIDTELHTPRKIVASGEGIIDSGSHYGSSSNELSTLVSGKV